MTKITVWNVIKQEISIPTNVITFFIGNMCPPGWEIVDELQGRIPVGSNGILGASLGSSYDLLDPSHVHTMDEHSHTWDASSTGQAYNGLCQVAAGSEENAACLHTHPIYAGTSTIAGSATETSPVNIINNVFGGTFCRKL